MKNVDSLKINGHFLTDEQKMVPLSILEQNELTKVIAYAGAGKTSTLEALPNLFPDKRILYVVYNKKMKDEAEYKFRKYPNVLVKTAHSLAYSGLKVGERFGDRLGNIRYQDIKNFLNLGYQGIGGYSQSDTISATIGILNNFFYSNEKEVSPKMMPYEFKRKALVAKALEKDFLDAEELSYFITDKANDLFFNHILNKNSSFPITHDCYLKIWQLKSSRGIQNFNLILLDEAQDSNPVILESILSQDCQKVLVGDPHQSIYSWRGAIDAMSKIQGKECYLTQSFRFGRGYENGFSKITEIGNSLLRIKGFHKKEEYPILKGFQNASKGDGSTAVICRSNAECIVQAFKRRDYNLVGDFRNTIQMIMDLNHIKDYEFKKVKSKELKDFYSLEEIEIAADVMGEPSLKGALNLYKKYPLEKIISLLTEKQKDKEYKNKIITAHSSKGLEWSNVILANDFKSFFDDDNNILLKNKKMFEELNLLYVAATRAKSNLEENNALSELVLYEKNNFTFKETSLKLKDLKINF